MANRSKINQKIPKKEESHKETISSLKGKIRRLESDKRKLKSEVETLTAALEENLKFLKGQTKDLSLEDLIEAAKSKKSLREARQSKVSEACKKCLSTDLFISKVESVGVIILCKDCKFREVKKNNG